MNEFANKNVKSTQLGSYGQTIGRVDLSGNVECIYSQKIIGWVDSSGNVRISNYQIGNFDQIIGKVEFSYSRDV